GGSITLRMSAAPRRSGAPAPLPASNTAGTSLLLWSNTAEWLQEQSDATPERQAVLERDPLVGSKKPFQPRGKGREYSFDPELESASRFWDLLPDLARTYRVDILADAYSAGAYRASLPALTSEPRALFQLLDEALRSSHRWEHQGTLVCLRSRTWF